MFLGKLIFPKDFVWGSATASYQVEGGFKADGKGESIWDRFTRIPDKIADNSNGDIACDSYHLYRRDVEIMNELGLGAYRFSVSWPRIFPEGTGKPNQKGLDYYKRLIEALTESGIKPVVTLYHWDLPQKLQDKGGWANRDVTDYFEEYSRLIYKELGDSVHSWITHNEPWVVSFMGNWYGREAPGITDFSTALLVSHNVLLSHGKAVNAYRETGLKGEIGITLNMSTVYPATSSEEDKAATARADGFGNRWFSDPVLKGKYPEDMLEWYSKCAVLPDITEEDLRIISAPVDFLGINNYFAGRVKAAPGAGPLEYVQEMYGQYRTDMGWGINPEGMYDLLHRLHKDYNGVKIYITENGTACRDIINREGKVEDDNRIDFIYSYLAEVHKAIQEGVHVAGYFVWTLMDNFEWALGFSKKFGLVYVDFSTQKRTIKKSGYWYRDVIKNNGFETIK